MAESFRGVRNRRLLRYEADVVYLVNIRLDAVGPHSAADVRNLLREAAVHPESGVEHIYVQQGPPTVEAVLFLAKPTLAEAELSADAVLERCAAGGPRFVRRSTVSLTMLVELLPEEADRGDGGLW